MASVKEKLLALVEQRLIELENFYEMAVDQLERPYGVPMKTRAHYQLVIRTYETNCAIKQRLTNKPDLH